MAEHPEEFTLLNALAGHLALKELGCDVREIVPSYHTLTPEERKLLHGLNEQLVEALDRRLVRGSSFGWLLWIATRLLCWAPGSRRRQKSRSGPSPQLLAREYTVVSEKVPLKGRKLAGSSR